LYLHCWEKTKIIKEREGPEPHRRVLSRLEFRERETKRETKRHLEREVTAGVVISPAGV